MLALNKITLSSVASDTEHLDFFKIELVACDQATWPATVPPRRYGERSLSPYSMSLCLARLRASSLASSLALGSSLNRGGASASSVTSLSKETWKEREDIENGLCRFSNAAVDRVLGRGAPSAPSCCRASPRAQPAARGPR